MATNLKFIKIATVPSTGLTTGTVYFETSTGLIKVATSATAVQTFSGVTNVTNAGNIVTFTKSVGDPVKLDLSDVASAESVAEELAKKLNIGNSGDASSVQSYHGLKKYADEAEAAALSAAKAYTDEQIEAIPAAVVYKGDGTTITQSGSSTVTFAVGTIAQSKVSGLSDALAGKANKSHTHTKSQITDFNDDDYATAAQGTKADSAVQSVRASNTGTNISIAAAKSGTTINLTPSLTTSTVTSGGSGLVIASDVKSYITSQLNAAVSSALKYKGSCTYAELPKAPAEGDVWNVTDKHGNVPAGTNYAWNGEEWDPLAGTVDLSPYLLSSTAASTYATKSALTSGLAEKANTEHTHVIADVTNLQSTLDGKVPTTRTINGTALTGNITLDGADLLVGGTAASAASTIAAAIKDLEDDIAAKPSTDTNTTYTFASGSAGSFTVTPSSGSAQTVSIGKPATAGTADKVAKKLTISLNGTAQTEFDGSAAVSFNITPASIGAATTAQGAKADSALQKADITTGTANGAISVDGTNVQVKGLGSAAYTNSSAYDAAGSASSALTNAKEYADSLHVWATFE